MEVAINSLGDLLVHTILSRFACVFVQECTEILKQLGIHMVLTAQTLESTLSFSVGETGGQVCHQTGMSEDGVRPLSSRRRSVASSKRHW